MREKQIQNDILRVLGAKPWLRLWRANVGLGKTPDGKRTIRFGLPGSADLTGILHDGRRLEIEVKRPGGRPSQRQAAFGRMIRRFGGVYIVATSVEDALQQLEREGYSDGRADSSAG